ncbi:GntR family transcriptional regulator [Sphingomonas sp. HF-S4]|uniref:GntR family transcriptional regulator n=1 Tax=Sphingomonas agrestis TaxID=3080540 RepID=A0ABU3Y1T7_9SPHN|nr:GntR family transcriptional regulator [Sphingomonas sp. HF-S4]MDV3455358.1 GntR family transcriptional regulator [Sphingomonas sp. HF-S4]
MARKGLIEPAERLSDKVYAKLREEIDSGTIAAGQRLVEVEVAGRYGVSRTPVREALIRLAREGALEPAERGFALPSDDHLAMRERLEARRLLDVALARAAAAAIVRGDVDTAPLDAELRRAASAHAQGRARAFANAHHALRAAIRAIAGNRLLARCGELVDDSFRLGREQLYRVAGNREATLAADRALVAALLAGDADAAQAETLAFIARVESHAAPAN